MQEKMKPALKALARLGWYKDLSADISECITKEGLRAERGEVTWPEWCLLSWETWHQVTYKYTWSMERAKQEKHWQEMSVLGPWRYSQGVYEFDGALFKELLKTTLDDSIPVDVLLKLPEWSQYILTPDYKVKGKVIDGFWVALHWSMGEKKPKLCIGLLYEKDVISVMKFDLSSRLSLSEIGDYTWFQEKALADKEDRPHISKEHYDQNLKDILPLLNLVAYLCADQPGESVLRRKFRKPKPKASPKGRRQFLPNEAKLFRKGDSRSDALRNLRWSEAMGSTRIENGYWIGEWLVRDGGAYSLRWIPPRAKAATAEV